MNRSFNLTDEVQFDQNFLKMSYNMLIANK
jgi:hypothetical protein